MLAEFRALRATVLRLYEESGASELTGVRRFNEAMDEAMTESLERFGSDRPVSGSTGASAFGIKWLERDEGWSQEKLAEKANLHRTYVGGIEVGIRNPSLRRAAVRRKRPN